MLKMEEEGIKSGFQDALRNILKSTWSSTQTVVALWSNSVRPRGR